MSAAAAPDGPHVVPEEVAVCPMACGPAFAQLDDREKRYAHHLTRAAWEGGLICLYQASVESPAIFRLLQQTFRLAGGPAALREKCAAAPYNVPDAAYGQWLQYVASFYGNLGNYYASGDLKFIPRCSVSDVDAIVRCAAACAATEAVQREVLGVWEECRAKLFSLEKGEGMVGWPPQGVCSYYSPDVTEADVKLVSAFCAAPGLPPDFQEQEGNSRLWGITTAEGTRALELRLASSEPREPQVHHFQGVDIRVVGGEYAAQLQAVVREVQLAVPFAANEHQTQMLHKYIEFFKTGDIHAHVQSQRHWVDDQKPVVETQLGFIEPFRDPSGLRGEWQGTIAVVDKAGSAKFNALVDRAEEFLRLFPWPREFENDVFFRPDFTSVEVLAFAGSHIWAGQNLPNYDHIRRDYGYKNLSYGNVTRADFRKRGQKSRFLSTEDAALCEEFGNVAFEVQVGIHELLGHGSGKLFVEKEDGTLNFDPAACRHPLTGGPIQTWYKPGQTYAAVFQGFGNAMEECRADSCGLYLCSHDPLLEIFGVPEAQRPQVAHANWLREALAGVRALEYYSPEERKWRQPHMQGAFAILRVLLEAGQGFVQIRHDPTAREVSVSLDMTLLESVGRPALAQLLLRLHVHKSTADVAAARDYFLQLTQVSDEMLALREVVMAHPPPKGLFVQANTFVRPDGGVELVEYPGTPEGMVQSFLDRFPE
eukprot:EG_transcript_3028